MIEITRSLARQVRAVIRQSILATTQRGTPVPVLFRAGPDGLRIEARGEKVAVRYHEPGKLAREELAVDVSSLADCEGRQDSPVRLEAKADGVMASWQDGSVPITRGYEPVPVLKLATLPGEQTRLVPQPGGFQAAMYEAAMTAARERIKFALDSVLLRGAAGEMVATDSKQLLIQGGFSFPWEEDLIVPRVPVFGCRELPTLEAVAVGRNDQYVVVRVGAWTIYLSIQKDLRFPPVNEIIPSTRKLHTAVQLSGHDAAFLTRALPHLPGADEDQAPLTVDCSGQLRLRAKAQGQPRVTEVVLSQSQIAGPATQFVCNRMHLFRAVRLGCLELMVFDPSRPMLLAGGNRKFVCMPLSPDTAIPPTADATRIQPDDVVNSCTSPQPQRGSTTMRQRRTQPVTREPSPQNGVGAATYSGSDAGKPITTTEAGDNQPDDLIGEVEALKDLVRGAYTKLNALGNSIKRHRKQAKLVKSTLASLRQLQQVAA